MLHAQSAEIIQKESERFSVFNSEETIRMWSEGEEFKQARQEGHKKITKLILPLSVNSD